MLTFKFDNCGFAKTKILQTTKTLVPEIKKIAAVSNYEDDRASVHLPFDKIELKVTKACISLKKRLKPKLLVVVGIGGSNLGTIAVQEALLGKHYNLSAKTRVMYVDTVDPDLLTVVAREMKSVLRSGDNVILNVISKSGATTETVANFEVLYNVLAKNSRQANESVVVTTNKGSKLWNLASKRNFSVLEIPTLVGGRYSVLSPVGLFPLGLLGVNLDKLLEGAALMRKRCATTALSKNPAAIGASLIFLHSKQKRNIYDHFLFATDLEGLGRWYRQLLAESCGKEHSTTGKQVFKGITPTVSVGSTDLHSVAQLYLGGPNDKFTNFVSVNFNNKVAVPNYEDFNALVSDIQGKQLSHIMKAILSGVSKAYKKGKRPFTYTRLEFKDEKSVGAFLQLKMIETMLLGKLLKVNPFNQPNVESYKSITRTLLQGK